MLGRKILIIRRQKKEYFHSLKVAKSMSESADILRTGQILAVPHILRDYSITVFFNTRQTPFRPHLLPQKRNSIYIPLKQRYLLVLNHFF